MTSQVHLNGRDQVVDADPIPAHSYMPTEATPAAKPPVPATAPRPLTDADRQGLAMGWAALGLGMFLLFGGLALWAAVALDAGFAGWLGGMALIGAVIVVVLLTVTYMIIRPRS